MLGGALPYQQGEGLACTASAGAARAGGNQERTSPARIWQQGGHPLHSPVSTFVSLRHLSVSCGVWQTGPRRSTVEAADGQG